MTPLLRMTLVIGVLYPAMKLLVGWVSGERLSPLHWVAFFPWPGMRPALFARRGPPLPSAALALRSGGELSLGLILFAGARALAPIRPVPALLLALPAFSLTVHFGLLGLLAAGLRRAGFPVEPLFRAPLAALSLGEFWGRRWNVGFSEMAAILVHRPVSRRFGRCAGLLAAFAFSGLLHEAAISLPVMAGFGLPFAYFILQGALVALEREIPLPRRGLLARVWTLFWLGAPLGALFHPWFLKGVVGALLGS